MKRPYKRRAPSERRWAVLRAAQAVLQRGDYHEIKMDDIAQRAGVAKGTLYLYFPTKEKLFQALAQELGRRTFERWKTIWDETSPGAERLRALVRAQLEFFEENRGIFLQVFQGNLPASCMGGAKKRSELIMASIRYLARAIDQAIRLGQLRRTNSLLAGVSLFGLIRGFVFARILGGMGGSLPGRADYVWEIFYRGLRP